MIRRAVHCPAHSGDYDLSKDNLTLHLTPGEMGAVAACLYSFL